MEESGVQLAVSIAENVFLEHENGSNSGSGATKATEDVDGAADSDMEGWWWCAEWGRYMHNASRCSYDPQTQEYSQWDEATGAWRQVQTGHGPAQAPDSKVRERTEEGEQTEHGASDVEDIVDDSASSDSLEDGEIVEEGNGDPGCKDAVVVGDWIWDGEFWVTADGISYHPGLGQYFSHGQRVFLREEDKPYPDDKMLYERWLADRYVLDYGTNVAETKAADDSATPARAEPEAQHRGAGTSTKSARQRACMGIEGGSIGRSRSCTVWINSLTLSKQHAALSWDEALARFLVRDCGSKRGTLLNGVKLGEEPAAMSAGDELRLGPEVTMWVGSGCEDGVESRPQLTLEWEVQRLGQRVRAKRRPRTEEEQGAAGGAAAAGERLHYRDRAKERRQMHAAREKAATRESYAECVAELEKRREEAVRSADGLGAHPATPCSGASGREPARARGSADADSEWLERGKKMLKKMGWQEGAGLGKNLAGRVEVVDAVGNDHRAGLGAATVSAQGQRSAVPAAGVGRMVAMSKLTSSDGR